MRAVLAKQQAVAGIYASDDFQYYRESTCEYPLVCYEEEGEDIITYLSQDHEIAVIEYRNDEFRRDIWIGQNCHGEECDMHGYIHIRRNNLWLCDNLDTHNSSLVVERSDTMLHSQRGWRHSHTAHKHHRRGFREKENDCG